MHTVTAYRSNCPANAVAGQSQWYIILHAMACGRRWESAYSGTLPFLTTELAAVCCTNPRVTSKPSADQALATTACAQESSTPLTERFHP